jgi:cyclopropane-fatty-acyl-phospholipid synthase
VLDVLRNGITVGHLTLIDGHESHEFGNHDGMGRSVTLRVVNADLWIRIMLSNDLGGQ